MKPNHRAPILITDDGEPLDTAEQAGAGGATVQSSQPVGTLAQLADFLLNGYWGGSSHHWGSNSITYNLGNLNASEQALALAALNAWHDVANVTFQLVASGANISFNHNGNMTAFSSSSWYGGGIMASATVDISSNWVTSYGTQLDSYSYQTYLHEIGHALGLGHQGPYNGNGTYGISNIYANDTWQFSVMSYFAQDNYSGGSYRFVMTPEMADIYAVDSTYGAASTRTGDTVYGFHSTAGSLYDFSGYSWAPALTIYDSGGSDTLDCSGYSRPQTINLTPGAFSSVGGLTNNIGIYATTTVENAIGGGGADTMIGNSANNTLNGGGGADTMMGLGGSDWYFVDNAGDTVIEAAGQGTKDYVFTTVSYTLKAGQEIELFTTTDHAGTAAINLTGNEFAQTIAGNAGNNVLNGGAGNDTLVGRGGQDTFVFNTALNAATNVDQIGDFLLGTDQIRLSESIFSAFAAPPLAGTPLAATAFRVIGSGAQDSDDRILYNSTTGALFYDADASGAGPMVQFATLVTHPGIDHTAFLIVA